MVHDVSGRCGDELVAGMECMRERDGDVEYDANGASRGGEE